MKFINTKNAQATTEFSILGMVLIMVFASMLGFAQTYRHQQDLQMRTQRHALEIAADPENLAYYLAEEDEIDDANPECGAEASLTSIKELPQVSLLDPFSQRYFQQISASSYANMAVGMRPTSVNAIMFNETLLYVTNPQEDSQEYILWHGWLPVTNTEVGEIALNILLLWMEKFTYLSRYEDCPEEEKKPEPEPPSANAPEYTWAYYRIYFKLSPQIWDIRSAIQDDNCASRQNILTAEGSEGNSYSAKSIHTATMGSLITYTLKRERKISEDMYWDARADLETLFEFERGVWNVDLATGELYYDIITPGEYMHGLSILSWLKQGEQLEDKFVVQQLGWAPEYYYARKLANASTANDDDVITNSISRIGYRGDNQAAFRYISRKKVWETKEE